MHIPVNGSYAEKYYFIDSSRFLRFGPFKESIDSIMKLDQSVVDAGDIEFSGELMLLAYRRSYHEGKVSMDSLEASLFKLAALAKSNEFVYLEVEVMQFLGDFYFENKKQQSAGIDYYIAAYDKYKNFKDDVFPAKQSYLYELAGCFYRYEDYESAIKYFREALKTKRSTNKNIYCSMYNTIGLCYRNMEIYDSAIFYFKKAHDIAVELNDLPWIGIPDGNIGITYYFQKKYSEAIPLIEKDIETSLANSTVKNAVGSMIILATIYNEQHETKKAEQLMRKALAIAAERRYWNDFTLKEHLYTQTYKAYAAANNYHLAWLYADSALMARDSAQRKNSAVFLARAHDKMSYTQHKLEVEKLQSDAKLQHTELSKKRIEIIFTLIGIAALLIVVLFVARERKRSENLLLNILPEKIADRLKKKEHPIADYFEHASIIFIDMAGFTVFSDGRDPKEIVNMLNHVFTTFDNLAEKHHLEKIKTIGDCYMAVSGLPEPDPNHAEAATQMALDIRAGMYGFAAPDGTPVGFRIGLDCGPVVAGVIGRKKFIYDLWGDTVNTASRMESTGLAGEIHCSDRFKKKIEYKHKFVSRGAMEIKGKGMMDTWLIVE